MSWHFWFPIGMAGFYFLGGLLLRMTERKDHSMSDSVTAWAFSPGLVLLIVLWGFVSLASGLLIQFPTPARVRHFVNAPGNELYGWNNYWIGFVILSTVVVVIAVMAVTIQGLVLLSN